jgi:hypothetical protein
MLIKIVVVKVMSYLALLRDPSVVKEKIGTMTPAREAK